MPLSPRCAPARRPKIELFLQVSGCTRIESSLHLHSLDNAKIPCIKTSQQNKNVTVTENIRRTCTKHTQTHIKIRAKNAWGIASSVLSYPHIHLLSFSVRYSNGLLSFFHSLRLDSMRCNRFWVFIHVFYILLYAFPYAAQFGIYLQWSQTLWTLNLNTHTHTPKIKKKIYLSICCCPYSYNCQ